MQPNMIRLCIMLGCSFLFLIKFSIVICACICAGVRASVSACMQLQSFQASLRIKIPLWSISASRTGQRSLREDRALYHCSTAMAELSEAEAAVYDRQLRVWGIEVQKRCEYHIVRTW